MFIGHEFRQPSQVYSYSYSDRKRDFELIGLIGEGAFGKVWKAQHRLTKETYALKIMDKAKILSKKFVKEIMNERQILGDLLSDPSDFIVNIRGAFQDSHKLYILMTCIEGLDLRRYMAQGHTLTEQQIKFIVVCLLKALDYLRRKRIIHQDIKPENIILDQHGFPRLADFSMATYFRKENHQQSGGTPGYMAPEILFHKNHSYNVDYYALGITVFELFFKKRPYIGSDMDSLRSEIYQKEISLETVEELTTISTEAADFIIHLLEMKEKVRLGNQGITQILKHPWLNLQEQYLQSFEWGSQVSPIMIPPNYKLKFVKEVKTIYQQSQQFFINLLDSQHSQNHFLKFDLDAGSPRSDKSTKELKKSTDSI